jgi:hypothetical protein
MNSKVHRITCFRNIGCLLEVHNALKYGRCLRERLETPIAAELNALANDRASNDIIQSQTVHDLCSRQT